MKSKYNSTITAQKAGVSTGVGAVGVLLEMLVNEFLPGMLPDGIITAITMTVFTAVSNWWKNR
jgi:hypothetical protein